MQPNQGELACSSSINQIIKIMKRYYVSVTETLNKVVSVDAESMKEAKQKVEDAYYQCAIVLDYDNFCRNEIEVEENDQFYKSNDEAYDGYYQHID